MPTIDTEAHRVDQSLSQIPPDPVLAEYAETIRSIGKRVATDIIEIGRLLIAAKDRVGHGGWGQWLNQEFDWTDRTAQHFIAVYELQKSKSENFSDLNLPVSALYLLARPSTPEQVRDEIISRAASGEKLSVATVKEAIADNQQDDQTKAKPEQAKEKKKKRQQSGESRQRLSSRAARWAEATSTAREALSALQELQQEYQSWQESLPENLQNSATAEKLDAVCNIDFDTALELASEAENIDLPLGFGRD
jgi:hypothetical protein